MKSISKQKAKALKEKATFAESQRKEKAIFDDGQLKEVARLTAEALQESNLKEESYKNREIDEKFSDIGKRFDTQDTTLGRIEGQVKFTNGRVSKLERIAWVLGTVSFMLLATKPELLKLLMSMI